ncbi:Transcription initiation factor TFIID subunit 12 [Coemansia erecta]|uniref:TBP-associated factor 12 n=1 Tax=Coemansia erecta TaxID=147472 RepID=A0A9W8CRM3_9FUNG|nr:Transcription initiation factor TFIID subunit 12 [Coemansia erecta]
MAGDSSNGGSPGPSDKVRKSAGQPRSPVTAGSVGSSSGGPRNQRDTPAANNNSSSSSSGIVLSPAMIEQMHEIISNHAVLKRDADNNVPFTNHLLDLIPTPAEFTTPHLTNTSQATAYINQEAGKIRAHLTVVQQTVGNVGDPDAKRRLEREIEMLEQHINQVKEFMRSSFHSALSGNPATQPAFGLGKAPAGKRGLPGVSPLTPGVMAKAQAPQQTPAQSSVAQAPRPATPVQSSVTRVAMSSALAHVAQQSTRANVPVDPDQGRTPGSRILSKRKIQELVGEIDPLERLEPAVEDILCDIADEFIESVTAFACQLAKHRRSDTLEAKDLQLHLERNWNIRIPGFAAEEIRSVRKSAVSSAHQEKMTAIVNTKNFSKFE